MKGELELNVVFPGLCCDMLFVVASIGSDGLLGTEGHPVVPATSVGSLNGTVVGGRPIDTTITPAETDPGGGWILDNFGGVASFLVSGVRPSCCALVELSRTLTEEYGVIVGHTLVNASSRMASVLMVNPNTEEVVLPSFTCVGKLVPVSAISVALADPGLPNKEHATLPEHLEEIIAGSHPSLACYSRVRLSPVIVRGVPRWFW